MIYSILRLYAEQND